MGGHRGDQIVKRMAPGAYPRRRVSLSRRVVVAGKQKGGRHSPASLCSARARRAALSPEARPLPHRHGASDIARAELLAMHRVAAAWRTPLARRHCSVPPLTTTPPFPPFPPFVRAEGMRHLGIAFGVGFAGAGAWAAFASGNRGQWEAVNRVRAAEQRDLLLAPDTGHSLPLSSRTVCVCARARGPRSAGRCRLVHVLASMLCRAARPQAAGTNATRCCPVVTTSTRRRTRQPTPLTPPPLLSSPLFVSAGVPGQEGRPPQGVREVAGRPALRRRVGLNCVEGGGGVDDLSRTGGRECCGGGAQTTTMGLPLVWVALRVCVRVSRLTLYGGSTFSLSSIHTFRPSSLTQFLPPSSPGARSSTVSRHPCTVPNRCLFALW
jgi:hypothetical protein